MNKERIKIALYLNSRILLMIFLQGITYFILIQKDNSFELSGFYWAIHLTIINLFLMMMMVVMFKRNGEDYFGFFKQFNKKDTVYFLKILVPLMICAMVPNIFLSIVLYQDPQIGTKFLLGDLPFIFIVINITIFPVLQGLVELPFYFSFIMPKLKTIATNKWMYLGLPVFFLSIQHAFMPLRFDGIYILYRSVMFFPFALFVGVLMNKKPTMMPYVVVLHILMNASLFMMYFIR